ncbi:centromere protein P isoform X4 [Stigmatopora nigra]
MSNNGSKKYIYTTRMVDKMNKEKNTELMELEDEIRLLQEEVAELRRTCQRYQPDLHPSQAMRDAMSLACGHMPQGGAQMVLSNLREEVEQLEEDLKQQSSTDAISLRKCIIQTLHSDGIKSEKKMHLSGRCSNLDFQVDFELFQVQGAGEQRPAPFFPDPAAPVGRDGRTTTHLPPLSGQISTLGEPSRRRGFFHAAPASSPSPKRGFSPALGRGRVSGGPSGAPPGPAAKDPAPGSAAAGPVPVPG